MQLRRKVQLKPLICNLKMEHSLQDILRYKKELENCVGSYSLIVCPPFCYLPIMHSKYYKIGAQDVSCYGNGSYTGKVSAQALKSLDVYGVLIGHSEIEDSFESKLKKLRRVVSEGMQAYVLISDTKEEHDYQYSYVKLMNKIRAYLSRVLPKDYKKITFVYEPSWLIGGNETLLVDEIVNLFYQLKKELQFEYKYDFPLFYGGGISSTNIQELYDNDVIDGLLLGNFCKRAKNLVKFLQKDNDSTQFDTSIHN